MNVLILSGPNHGFEKSAGVIEAFLSEQDDLAVTLTEEKGTLASSEMDAFDVCVFGTGFTRFVRDPDGSRRVEPDLAPEQEEGLLEFVNGGKGIAGVHGTAWCIGGRAVDLLGGHANWHPKGSTFTVRIEDEGHPVTQELSDFEVTDEIYMSAYDPAIHVLGSAECYEKSHPMAWVKPYGDGRVFYTALGHGPDTFRVPAVQKLVTQGVRWAGGG